MASKAPWFHRRVSNGGSFGTCGESLGWSAYGALVVDGRGPALIDSDNRRVGLPEDAASILLCMSLPRGEDDGKSGAVFCFVRDGSGRVVSQLPFAFQIDEFRDYAAAAGLAFETQNAMPYEDFVAKYPEYRTVPGLLSAVKTDADWQRALPATAELCLEAQLETEPRGWARPIRDFPLIDGFGYRPRSGFRPSESWWDFAMLVADDDGVALIDADRRRRTLEEVGEGCALWWVRDSDQPDGKYVADYLFIVDANGKLIYRLPADGFIKSKCENVAKVGGLGFEVPDPQPRAEIEARWPELAARTELLGAIRRDEDWAQTPHDDRGRLIPDPVEQPRYLLRPVESYLESTRSYYRKPSESYWGLAGYVVDEEGLGFIDADGRRHQVGATPGKDKIWVATKGKYDNSSPKRFVFVTDEHGRQINQLPQDGFWDFDEIAEAAGLDFEKRIFAKEFNKAWPNQAKDIGLLPYILTQEDRENAISARIGRVFRPNKNKDKE